MINRLQDLLSLEELISLQDPIKIRITRKNNNKPRYDPNILQPYYDLKDKLGSWKKQNHLDKIDLTFLKKNNGKLWYQLSTWAYVINGTNHPKATIKHMGFRQVEKQTLLEYEQNILALFPEDFILKFFYQKLTTYDRHAHISSAPEEQQIAFYARKCRTKLAIENKSFETTPYLKEDILDKEYSYLQPEIIVTPSQLLRLRALDDTTIDKLITDLKYSGQDLHPEQLEKTPLGALLIHFIKNPNNRPGVPWGERNIKREGDKKILLKVGYHKGAAKYLSSNKSNKFTISDLGANKSTSRLLELEFSFVMSIIKKYDPNMTLFQELKSKIGSPLQEVFFPAKSDLRLYNFSDKQHCDGRIISGDKTTIVEIKNSTYGNRKLFFESLDKYKFKDRMWDGTRIDNKLLFVDKPNGSNIEKRVSVDGWKLITGDEYTKIHSIALNLLYDNFPKFAQIAPLNTELSRDRIHELLHGKSYMISGREQRTLRAILTELLKKNINQINSPNIKIAPYPEFKQHYKINLQDIKAYPEIDLTTIPENTFFFDGEFTGFRSMGSIPSMLCYCIPTKNEAVLNLLFARNLFEEHSMLKEFGRAAATAQRFVGYNSKHYDLPLLLEERMFTNLICEIDGTPVKQIFDKPHDDLYLTFFRALARATKQGGKVKDFEKNILLLDRRGDVDGEDVPQIIFDYALDGQGNKIPQIIAHCIMDVATLLYGFNYRERLSNSILTPPNSIYTHKPRDISLNDFKSLFEKQ